MRKVKGFLRISAESEEIITRLFYDIDNFSCPYLFELFFSEKIDNIFSKDVLKKVFGNEYENYRNRYKNFVKAKQEFYNVFITFDTELAKIFYRQKSNMIPLDWVNPNMVIFDMQSEDYKIQMMNWYKKRGVFSLDAVEYKSSARDWNMLIHLFCLEVGYDGYVYGKLNTYSNIFIFSDENFIINERARHNLEKFVGKYYIEEKENIDLKRKK